MLIFKNDNTYPYDEIKVCPYTKLSEQMTEDWLSNCGRNSDLVSMHKSLKMLNSLKYKFKELFVN